VVVCEDLSQMGTWTRCKRACEELQQREDQTKPGHIWLEIEPRRFEKDESNPATKSMRGSCIRLRERPLQIGWRVLGWRDLNNVYIIIIIIIINYLGVSLVLVSLDNLLLQSHMRCWLFFLFWFFNIILSIFLLFLSSNLTLVSC